MIDESTGETAAPIVLLSRAQMLNADDTVYDYVHVPQWGGHVRIKSLTAGERERYEESTMTRVQTPDGMTKEQVLLGIRAKLVVLAVVDEKGQAVFKKEDAPVLLRKNTAAVQLVYEAIQRLSGMRKADVVDAGETSSSARNGASSSGSPATWDAQSPNSDDDSAAEN